LSYYYESRLLRLGLGQLYIIIYSVIAAWLGVNLITFAIIMILVILTSYIQSRFFRGNPISAVKASVEDVLSSRKLLEERNVRELQMKDEGLVGDMQSQLRFSTYMLFGTLAGLLYFFIAWGHVPDIYEFVKSYIGSDFLSHMLAFLIYLEGFFIISQLSTEIALRRAGRITVLSMPNEYIVTSKGIVVKGLLSSSAIAFPLSPHVEVRLEEKRGFVDIINSGSRSSTVIRLYSRDPRRLYEIIRRYGLPKESE